MAVQRATDMLERVYIERMSSIAEQVMCMVTDPDFQDLNARLHRPNFFTATDMNHRELHHSAFLAWLLNPSAPHGLQDSFIRMLLALLFQKRPAGHFASLVADDLSALTVTREQEDNIDILLRTEDARMVLCIENKVRSWLHDDQLDKYYSYVEQTYKDYHHRIYVFLTPSGCNVPKEESVHASRWIPLSYGEIITILNRLKPQDVNRTSLLIEDYADLLRKENIVADENLDKLTAKLYKKYAEVFEAVFARSLDHTLVHDHLKRLYLNILAEMKNNGALSSCSPQDEDGEFLWFQTAAMDEYLRNDAPPKVHSWNDYPYSTYHYWIHSDISLMEPKIIFEIGTRNQSEEILTKARRLRDCNTDETCQPKKCKQCASNKEYYWIYEFQPDIHEQNILDPDDINDEQVTERIKEGINNFLVYEHQALEALQSGK